MILKAIVGADEAGGRLDHGLRKLFPVLSKTQIRRIIDWGGCTVDNAKVRVASRKLRQGEEIVLGVIEKEKCLDLEYSTEDILYEDDDCLAVNKEAGFNAQRTPYQLKGTVEFAVERYLRAQGNREPARVIHRLDRGTSGVMIFPKNRRYAAYLSELLKEGRVAKRYLALVTGVPPADVWETDQPIAKIGSARYGVATPGKDAKTLFRVVSAGRDRTLVEATPVTGRTHQIRVHLDYCGLPIVGDTTYGGIAAPRMMLHCFSMAFETGNGKVLAVVAPLDQAFTAKCAEAGIQFPDQPQP